MCKILKFVAVGARQSFQVIRQIAWFLGNDRVLSKFRYRILYNLISITKLQKNHSIKAKFNLNTRATLSKCLMKLDLKMYKHLWKEELLIFRFKTNSNNNNLVYQDWQLRTCFLEKTTAVYLC